MKRGLSVASDTILSAESVKSDSVSSFNSKRDALITTKVGDVAQLQKLEGGTLACLELDNASEEMLVALYKRLESKKNEVPLLKISVNGTLNSIGYQELGKVSLKSGAVIIRMNNCNLDRGKLEAFQKGTKSSKQKVELERLSLSKNQAQSPDSYAALAKILHSANVKCLSLRSCDLTEGHLAKFVKHLGGNVRLTELCLDSNKTMDYEACIKVAEIITKTGIKKLSMRDCGVDEKMLASFGDGLKNKTLAIEELDLRDHHTNIGFLWTTVKMLKSIKSMKKVSLSSCSLDLNDLGQITRGPLLEHLSKVKIAKVRFTARTPPSENCYKQLAMVIKKVEPEILILAKCGLNEKRIGAFQGHLECKEVKNLIFSPALCKSP